MFENELLGFGHKLTYFHVVHKEDNKMSNLARKSLLSMLSTRTYLQNCGPSVLASFHKRVLSKRTFASISKFPRQFGSIQQRWLHQKNVSQESFNNLSKYLESEIGAEMEDGIENVDNLLEGWTKNCEGVKVVLSKKVGKETVRVSLSISGALEGYEGPDDEDMETDAPLLCKPPFEVEIEKPSGNTLAIRCMINDDMAEDPEDDVSDIFEILNVTMHNGKPGETTYVCESENMDQEMYEGLLDVLEERGIDKMFTQNLVEFCTKYEKKEYVDFLTSMKKFADE